MKNCSIVIGSFWGDEGKGHMTDILCSKKPNTLNVRFCGGAQASHTVETLDGKRHAFRHFGSGIFAESKTYLSEDFIVNPVAFVLERKELEEKFGIMPLVFIHPDAIVTTFVDTAINQAVEVLRRENRHGSCGFGINETMVRSEYPEYKITVKDLIFQDVLREKLLKIQCQYAKMRLMAEYNLSICDLPQEFQKEITSTQNIDMFLFYVEEFIANVNIVGYGIFNRFENIVFEGAQGLLLDQNNLEYFPHVTHANTGIKNVMKILGKLGFKGKVDIYYMSRCYLTRHGAGPMKNELTGKPYEGIVDLTNIPNDFQGTLRFGYLDFDLLAKEIQKDLKNLTVRASVQITFTCLDQVDGSVKYLENGELKQVSAIEFLERAWGILSGEISSLSAINATVGPTRNEYFSYQEKAVAYV